MHIFFDESVHLSDDFAIGAFVVVEQNPQTDIGAALASAGFDPEKDEYKSGHQHSRDHRYPILREKLYGILRHSKIGLAIMPASPQAQFGRHAISGLRQIVRENGLRGELIVHFDEGIFPSVAAAHQVATELSVPPRITFQFESDSRGTRGIQLADLVAHVSSMMLLSGLGRVSKMIKPMPDTEDAGDEWPLRFELWARLRYQFFRRTLVDPTLKLEIERGLVDTTCAIYIAPTCNEKISMAAIKQFGQMHLGCIH